ncbi:MAG: hypothetical protein HQ503_06150 [Rhodospirillales bacterium]|nr:hypothetical protein [Rhodospirillales bacterium]
MNMQAFLRRMAVIAAFGSVIAAAPGAANAQSVADFYKGKTITLNIGYGAGGGYDTYARVLARHLGNHIPGNPTVVPKNMPGAGSLRAANYVYNATPKNGTNLLVFASSTALEPMFGGGKSKAKFDPTKFSWIGNMNQETFSCGVWKTSGIKSFDDLIKAKGISFGATGPAAITSQHITVFNNLAGTNIKIIHGYKGTKGINLAMQQGEVQGSCGLAKSSIQSRWQKFIDKGDLKIVVQLGLKKDPFFGDAAHVFDYAKSPEARKAMEIIFGRAVLGRPLAAAPEIPADRKAALRKAFVDTMNDPAFKADAKKTKIKLNWQNGADVDQTLAGLLAAPTAAVALAKKAMGRK